MSKLARVAFGMKSGVMALEVSQPGKDVRTCTINEMLFSSLVDVAAAIETGSVGVAHAGSATVPIDVGGVPFITFQVISGDHTVYPAIYESYGMVRATMTDTAVIFYNNTGATRYLNYQIWNKRLL